MKFKFTYENILKTKKVEKDVAHRDFMYASQELEVAVSRLGGMYQQVSDSRELNMKSVSQKKLSTEDIAVLQWVDQFMAGQRVRIERQKSAVKETNAQFETKREHLSEVAKEYKIFEKLKEKMKEKFRKEQRKLEQKSIDELVVMYTKRGQR